MGEIPDNMVSVREVPWHKVGTVVDDVLTAKEALVLAGLDWNVTIEEVFIRYPGSFATVAYDSIDGQRAVVRATDRQVMQVSRSKLKDSKVGTPAAIFTWAAATPTRS